MIAHSNSIARVEYVFQASAEEVFDAWLDPALVAQWMFDPNICEQSVDRISIDPKPGGEFAYRVTRGGRQIEYRGNFLQIERPNLLVFTWITDGKTPETVVNVTIEALESGCRLTLVHDLRVKDEAGAERAQAEWEAELGSLEKTIH